MGSTAPIPLSLGRSSRLGGAFLPRWGEGGGAGTGAGGHAGRAAPLSQVRSMVGLEHTDDWGSGSTEETDYRSEGDDGAGAAEWDDVEFLSSFEFSEDSSDASGGSVVGAWGDGTAEGTVTSSLSERDAARLEEVGIMVRELEDGAGDDAASVAAGGGVGARAGTGEASAAPQTRSSREGGGGGGGGAGEGHAAAERRTDFVRGLAMGNARLRMTCGDPVFFGQLAELMQGLHRQSGGKKFLTHAEEIALGTKVQRYRQLIEVRTLMFVSRV